MSVLTVRGGVPRIVSATFDAAGRKLNLPFYTNYIQIRTSAAVKLYFTAADLAADAHFLSLVAPATGFAVSWEGPAELDAIWLKGVADVTVIAYQRRG